MLFIQKPTQFRLAYPRYLALWRLPGLGESPPAVPMPFVKMHLCGDEVLVGDGVFELVETKASEIGKPDPEATSIRSHRRRYRAV